jgi:hypothetical protein
MSERMVKSQKEGREFYWTPDFSFCGFANPIEITKIASTWKK